MEQNGLKDKDLIPYIGRSGRSIPAENLIQEYDIA